MSTVALGAGVVPVGKEAAVRQALTADIDNLESEIEALGKSITKDTTTRSEARRRGSGGRGACAGDNPQSVTPQEP